MGTLNHTVGDGTSPPARHSKFVSRWTDANFIAALTTVGIVLHLLLRYLLRVPRAAWQTPLIVILVAGGIPLVVPLVRKALAREFGSDHLAGISIVTSVFLGEYIV